MSSVGIFPMSNEGMTDVQVLAIVSIVESRCFKITTVDGSDENKILLFNE
jgi:hypothetical protein